jgi:rare lipoprotein A
MMRWATKSACATTARCALAALLLLAASGCAKKSVARNTPPPPAPSGARGTAGKTGVPPGRVPTIDDLYGYASWYGYPYHGRKTASGEIFDMNDLTAAHKTLPLGSLVRVTNQDNGREVEVRINDRGPFVEGRVIDLSYAAAKQIQMVGPGIALVRLSVLDKLAQAPVSASAPGQTSPVQTSPVQTSGPALAARPALVQASAVTAPIPAAPSVRYGVQVGAFRQRDNATRLQTEILQRHAPVTVAQSGDLFKVLVGAEPSEAAAQSLAAQLRKERFTGQVVSLPVQ